MRNMARKVPVVAILALTLGACSTAPRPLVPDSPEGPASYVCYNSITGSPQEVRSIAERQCSRWGMVVKGLIGQEWAPARCGLLTPMVAGFRCARPEGTPAVTPLWGE